MRVLISIATHHPTSSTIPIVQAAAEVLDRIFVQGVQYKRAGVIVMGISPNSPIQQDLFDVTAEQIGKMKRLDKVVDRINKYYGSETIVIGAQRMPKGLAVSANPLCYIINQ